MFRTTDFVEIELVQLNLYELPACKHVTVKTFRVGRMPLTRPWKPEYYELFIGV
jgi:hypothetical protein